MKKIKLMMTVLSLLAVSAMPASALVTYGTPSPSLDPIFGTLVDFDDKATGVAVGEFDYASIGIASIVDAANTLYTFGGSQSPPNFVGTGQEAEWAMNTTITFAWLTDMVGIGIADGRGETILNVYDANGDLIESFEPSGQGENYYVVFNEANNIASLEIVSDFAAIDDLQFTSAKVPEPSSLLLLGSGLAGLAFFRRKKMSA